MITIEYTLEFLAKADVWATTATRLAEEAIATSEILDEQAKDLLSAIMTRHALEHFQAAPAKKLSEIQLERLARGDKEWKVFQEGRFQARARMAQAKAKMKNAVRCWETVQSGLSYKREEMRRAIA